MSEQLQQIITVEQPESGMRFDIFIKNKINLKSRAAVKKKQFYLYPSKEPVKLSHIVKENEQFIFSTHYTEIEEKKIKPNPNIDLQIIFEDQHLLIINKQPNLAVHGNIDDCENNDQLVNAIVHRYGDKILEVGESFRPGIVHRIDKDTSGIMVIAKTNNAYTKLVQMFKDMLIKKTYIAIIYGTICPTCGTIENKISKSKKNYKKFVISEDGKTAIMSYETREIFQKMEYSMLSIQLKTGRTHQIRAQLENEKYPIIGDKMYSTGKLIRINDQLIDLKSIINRQALHSSSIAFQHPITQQEMNFNCDLPYDMLELISKLRS